MFSGTIKINYVSISVTYFINYIVLFDGYILHEIKEMCRQRKNSLFQSEIVFFMFAKTLN